ncbi:MAG: zinc-ribbon domain containing protein [Cyanobacteria bacterium P01_H01_bin.130]
MKSNKQRRQELKADRRSRAEKQAQRIKATRAKTLPPGTIPIDHSKLAPNNSYTIPPDFYVDRPFTCRDCGKEEIWTAEQQQWWCEVAKGSIWSTAIRCRPCRKIERDRKAEARRIHLEGIRRKALKQKALANKHI